MKKKWKNQVKSNKKDKTNQTRTQKLKLRIKDKIIQANKNLHQIFHFKGFFEIVIVVENSSPNYALNAHIFTVKLKTVQEKERNS